jgi:DNA-binding response OmpR family regulator
MAPRLRIMLVDDDPDFVVAQSAVLRRAGYEVLGASDAVSAVSVAVRERPQAVILDIGLPGGEGTTVMRHLHALPTLAGVPVIILSGRDPGRYRDESFAAGASADLIKPVTPADLLAALDAALSRAQDADEGAGGSGWEELAGRLVLLVDDDHDVLFALASELRRRGLEVGTAADAIAAVSTAVRMRPDVAIVGMTLPGGDGLTVMGRMRAMPQLAGVPVILLGDELDRHRRDAGLAAGAAGYLDKPVDGAEVLRVLRVALELDQPA